MNPNQLQLLYDLWPVFHTVVLVVLAVASFGWKAANKRLESMSAQLTQLNTILSTAVTTLAVVQSNLQQHTEQDRQSFHDLRNDFGARLSDTHRRLDAQRASIETIRDKVA